MNPIHPSAIVPVAVTWAALLFLFGLAFYFAFFAPAPEPEPDDAEPTASDDGNP